MPFQAKLNTLISLFIVALTSSCGHLQYDLHTGESQYANSAEQQQKTMPQTNFSGFQTPKGAFAPVNHHKLLSDYTEKMAMELVRKLRYVTERTPVAVTSFVEFDQNLTTTTPLGNQLAESFITELQEFGLSIVDFKHTGKIAISKKGDFSLSRNKDDLKSRPDIDYILTGTLTYDSNGVIVHARMIGVNSKVIVSSAKGYIPYFVIRSMSPTTYNDGIPSAYYQ